MKDESFDKFAVFGLILILILSYIVWLFFKCVDAHESDSENLEQDIIDIGK